MPNANANANASAEPAQTAAPPLPRRVARAAAFAGAMLGFAWLLASAHVPCGFATALRLPCPGCGSTRAMLSLAAGDLHGLVRYNPLAPFTTLFVAVLAGQALASLLATGTFRGVGSGALGMTVARGVILVSIVQVVVWIARFGGFLGGPVPV
jgi:hypothetical protein